MDSNFNLLVVEAKARVATSTRDIKKIRELTRLTGAFGYALGAYLHVQNKRHAVLRTGKVKMSVRWDSQEEDGLNFERKVPKELLAELRRQPD